MNDSQELLDISTQPDVLAEISAFDCASLREKVERLESMIFQIEGHVTELPVRHIFAKGLYARELTIPKGTVLTGRVHCEENLFIISKGDLSVLTEDGVKRVQAPFIMVTPPGTKRVGYAHEDTIVTTVHSVSTTDVEELESSLAVDTYQEYELRLLAAPGA